MTGTTCPTGASCRLYGFALLFILLPVEFGIGDRFIRTTPINGQQWLICIAFALALLLIDEVIKFFMRRSRVKRQPEGEKQTFAAATGD